MAEKQQGSKIEATVKTIEKTYIYGQIRHALSKVGLKGLDFKRAVSNTDLHNYLLTLEDDGLKQVVEELEAAYPMTKMPKAA